MTHSGRAHRDDLIAVALAVAKTGVTHIERRSPSQLEIDDPSTMILDVGRSYDPAKNNFDHHQDENLPCTAHLIARHFGLDDAMRLAYPWWDNLSRQDLAGPSQLGKIYGLSAMQLTELGDPAGDFLVDLFSEKDGLIDETIYGLLKKFGEKLCRAECFAHEMNTLKTRIDNADGFTLHDINGIKILVGGNAEDIGDPLDLVCLDMNILVTGFPDERSVGKIGLKSRDTDQINFLPVKNRTGVSFVANSGFYAVMDPHFDLEELICACRKPPSSSISHDLTPR